MLHNDAVSLALCGCLLLLGILTLVVAALFRRRAAAPLWIPAFCRPRSEFCAPFTGKVC
jgi:hypothetical protein